MIRLIKDFFVMICEVTVSVLYFVFEALSAISSILSNVINFFINRKSIIMKVIMIALMIIPLVVTAIIIAVEFVLLYIILVLAFTKKNLSTEYSVLRVNQFKMAYTTLKAFINECFSNLRRPSDTSMLA